MGNLVVKDLGLQGVNVDKDPLELADGELRQAQNAMREPNSAGLKNRPGLTQFNLSPGFGVVMGGIGVPLADLSSAGGTHFIYIGRGVS